jgi:hypothetical protein
MEGYYSGGGLYLIRGRVLLAHRHDIQSIERRDVAQGEADPGFATIYTMYEQERCHVRVDDRGPRLHGAAVGAVRPPPSPAHAPCPVEVRCGTAVCPLKSIRSSVPGLGACLACGHTGWRDMGAGYRPSGATPGWEIARTIPMDQRPVCS